MNRVQAVVPWLDQKTSALVAAIVAVVAAEHAAVQAAILFGSAARHEERPLDDLHPSDVDLLLLVAPDPVRQRLPYAQQLALWESIGSVQYRHCTVPREVEVTLVESTLADWDELFVVNVARDGRLLWIRDANPAERALDALPAAWRHLAPNLTDRTRR
ncbi:MAG TPA: nucleotidyltransferase domain-containing protein [Ktedonobacterales bacterium]